MSNSVAPRKLLPVLMLLVLPGCVGLDKRSRPGTDFDMQLYPGRTPDFLAEFGVPNAGTFQ
ncbi:hypothetical protein [Hymenobacter saemangeumensis]|uniref:hypothetical protein n=1 Tax=Hymenobacter saemangeumensis TaxID=1084522 RepID=UPI0031E858EA